MDVLEQLSIGHGFVVIPTYQSNGGGRGQNKWLSSDGSLMFTIQLQLSLGSVIGQRLPLLQHLTAVAIVKAIIGPEEEYQVSEEGKDSRDWNTFSLLLLLLLLCISGLCCSPSPLVPLVIDNRYIVRVICANMYM